MPEPDPVLITPRRPDVLDETFDGEAVLVNLRTGRYYALCPYATRVWAALGDEGAWPELADEVAVQRGEPVADVRAAVLPFLHRLVEEDLVALPAGTLPAAGVAAANGPSLQVFTDMEDLLLLDPIHDVDLDGTGWPRQPAPQS